MSIEDSIDQLLFDEHDDYLHDQESRFTLEDWKILSICLFPFLGALGISLALLLGTRTGNKLWFTCGVMFSSGILLAAALCHALPHANEMFSILLGEDDDHHDSGDDLEIDDHNKNEESHDEDHHQHFFRRYLEHEEHYNHEEDESHHAHVFPWANLIFGLTFYLLLVTEAYAERIVDNVIAKSEAIKNEKSFRGAHDSEHMEHQEEEKYQDLEETDDQTDDPTEVDEGYSTEKEKSNSDQHLHLPTCGDETETMERKSIRRQGSSGGLMNLRRPPSRVERSGSLSMASMDALHAFGNKGGSARSSCLVTAKHPSIVVGSKNTSTTNNEAQHEDVDEKQTVNPWVAILLLIVLSLHVLIEGLTIGSAGSVDAIKSNFVAIVSHKIFGAFTLGSSFIAAGYWTPENRKLFFVLSFIYVAMDIFGIGIGMALSSTFQASTFALAIFQSMLGGSFLFVAAVELIPGELEKTRKYRFPVSVVMLCLGIGYGLMALIGKWF